MNSTCQKKSLEYLDPRFLNIKLSPTLRAHQKQLKSTKKIYKFGFGQSPFPIPQCMQSKLNKFKHLKHYSPSQGELSLRKSISDWFQRVYKVDYPEEQIIVSPGSKYMFYLFQMIFSGELFLLSPCWVTYKPQTEILEKKANVIQCKKGKLFIIFFLIFRKFLLSN